MRGSHASRRYRWLTVVVIFVSGIITAVAACGLDDTVIPILGTGEDASLFDGGHLEASADASDAAEAGPTCIAQTCANFPGDCHPSIDAGCGQKIDCFNACPSDQACVTDAGAGVDGGYFCSGAPACVDAGQPNGSSCDTLTNVGNGLTTSCGACADGYVCTNNTCGCPGSVCGGPLCCTGAMPNCNDSNNACCARKVCADDHTQCSPTFSDGCGSTLNCQTPSNCIGGQVCDTATNMCCTVTTTCNTSCNTTLTTNCGTPLMCGPCATGTCDNTNNCCPNNVCSGTCCTPTETECMAAAAGLTTCCTPTTCFGRCGTANDNCGVANCETCHDGDTCEGSANCACGSASCTPGQTCHRGPPGGDHCSSN